MKLFLKTGAFKAEQVKSSPWPPNPWHFTVEEINAFMNLTPTPAWRLPLYVPLPELPEGDYGTSHSYGHLKGCLGMSVVDD